MSQGQIRIIGGQWRGRKLKVPEVPHLRPTSDRVRETLFNWLAPIIHGAHCLDAFAGSGALGFEALSRGAAKVVMTDQSPVVIKLLQAEAEVFQADGAEIYRAAAPLELKKPAQAFDVVFLDPPFQEKLLLPTCFYLAENEFLTSEALIYLEAPAEIREEELPQGWSLLKNKKAGEVFYHLIRAS